MYLHFTPKLLHLLYPGLLWHKARSSKTIYLTFDDGPIPEVTPRVLDMLKDYDAKATFFCVGDNVRKHSEVLRAVVAQGHRLGNHTYHHLSGMRHSTEAYVADVQACEQVLSHYLIPGAKKLFRPPYGRFTHHQQKALKDHYQLVMWDVLSADFDQKLSPQACLKKSIRYTKGGSVIIFHDSLKAWERLQWVLPRYLQHFSKQGYTFSAL